jgi:pimeloyl-ACP methyl ester carboxylesterase
MAPAPSRGCGGSTAEWILRLSPRDSGYDVGVPEVERAVATSTDGTPIGYRRSGRGPAIVLVHGGMMAAQNFTALAAHLAGDFTVVVHDRRGRGASGPYGRHYELARDCEDVLAVADATGAAALFGLSSGAIIALETALRFRGFDRVAAYEPPFIVAGRDHLGWVDRHAREVRRGKLGAAMLTIMKGTTGSRLLRLAPRVVVEPMLELGIAEDQKSVRAGDVPIAELIPTMQYDARLVREASRSLERYRKLGAEVLLLGGMKSPPYLREALGAVERVLPRTRRVELPDVGHLAADNGGRPEIVATALRTFFRDLH